MVWPDQSRQSFHGMTTEGYAARFIKAMQSLLDERDASKIDTLAQRLSPFRIDLQHKHVLDTLTIEPTLVFEENQQPAQYVSAFVFVNPLACWHKLWVLQISEVCLGLTLWIQVACRT